MKWVKTGMRMMEGWARKDFRMPRCQQVARPRSKPGRNMVVNVVAITGTLYWLWWLRPEPKANGEASASPLPRRERRQAAKMSRNLGTKDGQRHKD